MHLFFNHLGKIALVLFFIPYRYFHLKTILFEPNIKHGHFSQPKSEPWFTMLWDYCTYNFFIVFILLKWHFSIEGFITKKHVTNYFYHYKFIRQTCNNTRFYDWTLKHLQFTCTLQFVFLNHILFTETNLSPKVNVLRLKPLIRLRHAIPLQFLIP